MDHLVALKNEQTSRLVLRDTSLYVFIGTVFGVYAAQGQAAHDAQLVALIRLCSTCVTAIMLSIYVANDYYVSKIGAFVRQQKNVEATFGAWEQYHRKGIRYAAQKLLRIILVTTLFSGWTIYQSAPILSTGDNVALGVSVFFGGLVALQLLIFLSLSFDKGL